jgi:hypothetical protein
MQNPVKERIVKLRDEIAQSAHWFAWTGGEGMDP